MFRLLVLMVVSVVTLHASDLPTKQYLNLATIKTMVAASEAKAKELRLTLPSASWTKAAICFSLSVARVLH
jgi:hypothetical protein